MNQKSLNGFAFSLIVGGDWYDLFVSTENALGFDPVGRPGCQTSSLNLPFGRLSILMSPELLVTPWKGLGDETMYARIESWMLQPTTVIPLLLIFIGGGSGSPFL